MITIQSDTTALRSWNVPRNVYKDYDFVTLHSRRGLPVCNLSRGLHIVPRPPNKKANSYGFNAVLYTARDRGERLRRVLDGSTVDSPDDFWINRVNLKVGALCPPLFDTHDGEHMSSIAGAPTIGRRLSIAGAASWPTCAPDS